MMRQVFRSRPRIFERQLELCTHFSDCTSDRRVLNAALFLSCRYSFADMGSSTEQVAGKGAISHACALYMYQEPARIVKRGV